MLPNALNGLQVEVVVVLDEAHVSHDSSHCHLTYASVFVELEMPQHLVEVFLEALHK